MFSLPLSPNPVPIKKKRKPGERKNISPNLFCVHMLTSTLKHSRKNEVSKSVNNNRP